MERMIRKKPMPWAIVAIALSSWPQRPSANVGVQTRDDNGVVDGIVTCEDQKPVKDATVYAVPMGRPMAAIIPHAKTDELGTSQSASPRLGLENLQ
jgi:hypothetical protein